MSRRNFLILFGGIIILCLCGLLIYNLPPIQDRLGWRVDSLRAQIKRFFNPPEEVVFVPQEQVDAIVNATLTAMAPTATVTPTPTLIPPTAFPTDTPVPVVVPTETLTPFPPTETKPPVEATQ